MTLKGKKQDPLDRFFFGSSPQKSRSCELADFFLFNAIEKLVWLDCVIVRRVVIKAKQRLVQVVHIDTDFVVAADVRVLFLSILFEKF